jgi:hypothetical protein
MERTIFDKTWWFYFHTQASDIADIDQWESRAKFP